MSNRIAYVISRFPKISETFILREIIALENFGWEVYLYPLILEKKTMIHAEAEPWLRRLNIFPWISKEVITSNFKWLFRSPIKYIGLWLKIIWGNIASPSFLIRALALFPKAVLIADDMILKKIKHIHAHYATHPTLIAWIAHQLYGISYSVTVHAHDIYVDRTMLATKLKSTSFIVAISKFNQEFLAQHLGEWVREKIHIIHCGIDFNTYLNKSLPINDNGKTHLLSIGSLQAYKGMQYLIKACAILRNRGISFSCKIIGEGEERQPLQRLIDMHSLTDFVELVGAKKQEEVALMLKNSDIYLQPSVITKTGKMEGIPVALMEALASALPAIASDISGIPELIQNRRTGYLVPPAESLALANLIQYVILHPSEAKQIALNGQQLVKSKFNIYKNVGQLANLFDIKIGKNH